jgi:hypothetical protein
MKDKQIDKQIKKILKSAGLPDSLSRMSDDATFLVDDKQEEFVAMEMLKLIAKENPELAKKILKAR